MDQPRQVCYMADRPADNPDLYAYTYSRTRQVCSDMLEERRGKGAGFLLLSVRATSRVDDWSWPLACAPVRLDS